MGKKKDTWVGQTLGFLQFSKSLHKSQQEWIVHSLRSWIHQATNQTQFHWQVEGSGRQQVTLSLLGISGTMEWSLETSSVVKHSN